MLGEYHNGRRIKALIGLKNVLKRMTGHSLILASGASFLLAASNMESIQSAWTARYDGPDHSKDVAKAIAVDPSGNAYVTGYSTGSGTDTDYATIKYDSSGNQVWVARYNGPGNGEDVAKAIAVDPSGNVYVAGASTGSGTGNDYATIKYSSSGNQVWVARYNGSGSGEDTATSLALDSNGRVYVTGFSFDSGTGLDCATIKYSASGSQLWVARYNGSGNGDDAALDIAVDSSNRVFITGYSFDSVSKYDYVTIKYGSSGNPLWVAHYNGPDSKTDEAYALTIDGSGNVYVTGSSATLAGHDDYATVKYNANGTQLWTARYNGPKDENDSAHALAVDNQGHVYVTGASGTSATNSAFATVKYGSDGSPIWVVRYGVGSSYNAGLDLAIDTNQHVYVCGISESVSGGFDYFTIKYAP